MSKYKLSIARDALAFMGSSLFVQSLSFFLAIYVRRVLGPAAIGIWALLQVFLKYASYANLGMFDAVYREIPLLKGRKDEQGIREIKETALTFTVGASSFGSVLIVAGAFIFRSRVQPALFYGLLTLAAVNLLQKINDLFVGILTSERKFELCSRFRIYSALVNGFLVVLLTWKYALYGYFAATLLSFVYNVAYLLFSSKMQLRLSWHKEKVAGLLRFGVPFLALSFVTTLFNTADKVAIGKCFGLEQLGIYTIATMAGRYLMLLPNIFQQVLFPRILEKFGSPGDPSSFKSISTKPVNIVAVYFSLFIGLAWIASPYFCQLGLPKFVGGIPALKALIFAYAFMALSTQVYPTLLGHLRHLWMIPVALVLSAMIFGASAFAFAHGGTLAHVALITTAVYFVNYLFSFCFALGPLYKTPQLLRHLGRTLLPIFLSAAALQLFDRAGVPMTLAGVLLQLSVYLLLWAVLVWGMERNLGIVRMAGDTYRFWRASKKPLTVGPPAAALEDTGNV